MQLLDNLQTQAAIQDTWLGTRHATGNRISLLPGLLAVQCQNTGQ